MATEMFAKCSQVLAVIAQTLPEEIRP